MSTTRVSEVVASLLGVALLALTLKGESVSPSASAHGADMLQGRRADSETASKDADKICFFMARL